MIISNIKYYHDLPFEAYLAMPGTSFSSLKGEIPVSDGMRLGTRVHQYLTEPGAYDWQQVNEVRDIAIALRDKLGSALLHLQKEVAFTCDMIHNGMLLAYKGRVDLLFAGRVVVDLKILSGALEGACTRFGYPDQVSGYCLGTASPLGLIIAYNKTRKQVEVKAVRPTMDFWNYQVVRLGKPVQEALSA